MDRPDELIPVHMRPIMHAGVLKHVMIMQGECSWCHRPDTQCAVILRDTRQAISFNGGDLRPMYGVVAKLCGQCFDEYWRAGGSDREAI